MSLCYNDLSNSCLNARILNGCDEEEKTRDCHCNCTCRCKCDCSRKCHAEQTQNCSDD